MSSTTSSSGSGIGLAGILTVVFVVLKLTHNITWSWVWVLSPLWIGAVFTLACLVLFFLIAAIVATLSR